MVSRVEGAGGCPFSAFLLPGVKQGLGGGWLTQPLTCEQPTLLLFR